MVSKSFAIGVSGILMCIILVSIWQVAGIKRSQVLVERRSKVTVSNLVDAAVGVSASTHVKSPRSGQIYWGVNNAGKKVAYRYITPVRKVVTSSESNDVATAFVRIAEAYRRGERDMMRECIGGMPDVVTNMTDSMYRELVKPVYCPLVYEFLATRRWSPQGLKDFASVDDFTAYERINLDLTLFFGNLSLKREDYEGPVVFIDAAVLDQLLLYKKKFHDGGLLDFEMAADGFIEEWRNQIEAENGFTRQVMWFQVDLNYALYNEGLLTADAISARAKQFAQGLLSLGYTPKWLPEFDDLSEAVK